MPFTIADFKRIEEESNINELNNITIKIINNIAKKVGSSTYKKTPIFKKKKYETKSNNVNFKKTNFEAKLDEHEIVIDKIRNFLNKLTKNNYDEIKEEIIIQIKHFSYARNNIVLINICKEIFNISSINKFWCKIYANLVVDLIANFEVMKEICNSNFTVFLKIFDKIHIGNEDNYDEFCKINKQNEKRRALSKFYTCLYNNNVLSKSQINIVLEKLFCLVKNEITEKKIIEEIFENILIIAENMEEELSDGDYIIDELKEIYLLLSETNISKKMSFKLLDFFENNDIEIDDE